MARIGLYRKIGGIVAAAALVSSTASYAAPATYSAVSSTSISPIVALSLFASNESVVALCGSSAVVAATNAAAATAAVQPGPAPGCVLPIVDAPVAPVAPMVDAPVLAPMAVAQGTPFNLLYGLGAIAVAFGLFFLLRDNGDGDFLPISPG